jgi:hypothetical protein
MLLASRFVDVQDAEGPFRVQDELWYQPIAYRWAENLGPFDTKETNRFVTYYDSMSDVSGMVLAPGQPRRSKPRRMLSAYCGAAVPEP